MTETISVLISCYNYGRFLRQCLGSVESQTRPPDEIILVDDGSTDDTAEVAREFPRVRYFRQPNAGKGQAFNRAFAEATGDILCHLDADDFWELTKLERVAEALAANNNVGGVVHEVRKVGKNGQPLEDGTANGRAAVQALLTLGEQEEIGFLYPLPGARGRMFGNPTTISARRWAIADLFPLPAEAGPAVDLLFLAGALRAGLLYLPVGLSRYRIHGENLWAGNPTGDLQIVAMWRYLYGKESFRQYLPPRQLRMFRAEILERTAYVCSRTGQGKIGGALAAAQVPWLLLRSGHLCNWKHLILPAMCLLPIRRATRRPEGPASAPHAAASRRPTEGPVQR